MPIVILIKSYCIFFLFDPFYRLNWLGLKLILAHGTVIRCTDYLGTTVRKLHTAIYGRDYHQYICSVHIGLFSFY